MSFRTPANARLAALLIGLGLVVGAPAASHAGGAWLGSGVVPIEQRVAIAVAPDRTTLWTSLGVDGAPGAVGFVLPVEPGAALDIASDAWLEALEIATAPRVVPPKDAASTCPGDEPDAHPLSSTAKTDHAAALAAKEILVLADAASVASWASSHGLAIPPDVSATFAALSGKRFLAVAFDAPGGPWVSPTMRVTTPAGAPLLPLALTHAAPNDPLLVSVWMLGHGRGRVAGMNEVAPLEVAWKAADGTSDYAELRLSALAKTSTAALTEAADHKSLSHDVAIAGGTASIDGVVGTYFERGVAYAGSRAEVAACVVAGAAALASSSPVSSSCPRADLGVVDGTDSCVESPVSGQTDPDVLRCGSAVDDLAVALSGLVPAETWLTRQSLAIPAGSAGAWATIAFESGAPVSPVVTAAAVDLGGCDGGGGEGGGAQFEDDPGTTGSGSSGAPPPGGGSGVWVSDDGGHVYVDGGCSCSGTAGDGGDWDDDDTTVVVVDDGDGGEDVDEDWDSGSSSSSDDCEGDTSEEADSGDDCGGDTSEADTSGDDCEGDTAEGSGSSDDCSGETTSSSGSDDCGGDASSSSGGDSCDSGGSSSSSSGCDSGGGTSSSGDCSIASSNAGGKRARGPRLSALTLGSLFFLLPIRRLTRRRRSPKSS